MKRLFIGSTLLLSATFFLTGCISHAPVKSVHIVKAYPNHYNSSHAKNHAYTSHPTVKVYQTHYPKVVRYEPQRSSHYVYEQPIHKQHNGYVKTHKSIKPYKNDNKQNHSYSQKKVIKKERVVKVVQKSRPIIVNKPKNPIHQSRNADNRNPKTYKNYKNDRKESHKKDDSRSEQKSEHQSAEARKVKKVRTIQIERTYSRR